MVGHIGFRFEEMVRSRSHEMLRDDDVGSIEIGPSSALVKSDSLGS